MIDILCNSIRSYALLVLLSLCGASNVMCQELKLASPQVNLLKGIIKDKPIKIYFDFRMDNAEIRYTKDGSTPTIKSKIYKDTLFIKKACTIKAKAFHPNFSPSDEVVITLIGAGKEYASVTVNQANEKYKADGSWTINNKILGDANFKSNYLGYEGEPIILDIAFDKKEKVKEVTISYLVNQGAWIFSPSSVIITDEKGRLISNKNLSESNKAQDNQCAFIHILCKGKYKSLRIIIDPIDVIPNWHSGKGGKPWLMVDEVVVY